MHPGSHRDRRARAVRGSLAAAIATATAATAHTLAGDGAPPGWLLVTVTALAAPFAVALTGRALSTWRTAAIVIASQALLHAAFAVVGTSPGRTDAVAPGLPGHTHALTDVAAPTPLTPLAHGLHLDPPMLLAHALAAAVTVALLVHGERVARALGRGIRRLLPPVYVRPAPPCAARAVAPALRPALPAHLFHTTLSRRGPPAFAR